jgi:FkbM family methyltransferase
MRLVDSYPERLSVPVRQTRYREHAELAARHGVEVTFCSDCIEVSRVQSIIRIHKFHIIYLKAIIRYFDFYWESVEPRNEFGKKVCDFTPQRYHRVRGFELMPVFFPSLAEPVSTINQYLDLAPLEEGQTVIDLGAYAGLSSMLFSQRVGRNGRVIALEPDPLNHQCAAINLDLFKRLTGLEIELLNTAVWTDDAGLDFSADGCMGSSAVEFIGDRGDQLHVPSVSLDQLLDMTACRTVDLLKCDIEGAESRIFMDSARLSDSVKMMVIETHTPYDVPTARTLVPQLENAGFRCELVKQYGVDLPLLFATNLNSLSPT